MHTTHHKAVFNLRVLVCHLLLGSALISSNLSAQVVNGSQWIIQPGDSLYKIARTIYPESQKKQAQLRKQLVSQNPEIFKNGTGNISVGDKLQLPDSAIQHQEPAVEAAPVVAMPAPETKPTQATEIITPQPTAQPQTEPAPVVTADPQDLVGQVVINIGSLTAQNRGTTRELTRRSAIYRGDTLATGGRSLSQIRLKDGALLSLRPHTNIKIAEYNYNGSEDGNERSVIELLKGGFRTITGAIGHLNKQNYQIRTSMATIGIRGTHYSLVLCQQASCSGEGEQVEDGLYGGVADGSIVIENESGVHTFNNDQFFHLTSASALPVESLIPPHILNHDADQSAQQHPENAENSQHAKHTSNKKVKSLPRRLAVIFEPNQPDTVKKRLRLPKDIAVPPLINFAPALAPNGAGAIISFNENIPALTTGVSTPITINNNNDNVIILGPNRTPIAIVETYFDAELLRNVTNDFIAASADGVPIGLPSNLGRDTTLGVNWGRWNGDFTVRRDGTPIDARQNLHFIYSEKITSPTQLANLGGIKGSFVSYTSTGGTLPTDNQGNVGTNFANITIDVDFIAQTMTNYNINVSVDDASGTSVFYSANTFAPIPLANLGSSFTIDGTGCASGACTGDASVLFVGPEATGAITSYQINDTQVGTSITGTAVLSEGAPAQ